MRTLGNLKKRTTQLILVLLIFSIFWISVEYYEYFVSEDYSGYYNTLNVTASRPELANKLFKYLAERLDVSVELMKGLQEKGYIFGCFFNGSEDSFINISVDITFTPLEDIKQSALNTFFIESSCASEEMTKKYNVISNFVLNARQCCSIESAARTNPTRAIYILHTCPLNNDFLLHSPKYVQRLLLNYMNVHVVTYNATQVFTGTPVETLWNSKRMDGSMFPVEHSSDILRFTVLWRFGGLYCDLDVITLSAFICSRPLDALYTNYCGLENDNYVGSSILNFEPFGYGNYVLTKILKRINKCFNEADFTANGPDLVTSMVLEECGTTVVASLPYCSSFNVYRREVLFPLAYNEREQPFTTRIGKRLVRKLKKTGFTVHLWNRMTKQFRVEVGSSQGYSVLAAEFCPDVYANCGQYF